MLVGKRMTQNPVIVHPDTPFQDALQLLREKKVRRLPVVDKAGNVVGIVVEKDLLYASPSPATSLSVFEIHYLLSKLQVKDVMTQRVITVGEDCPLEEAARIMVDHRIGSLPIVRGKQLVGIITERDIAKAMRAFRDLVSRRQQDARIKNLLVADVMTKDVKKVRQDTPLQEVQKIILTEDRGGLPVVNDKDELVGMITRRCLIDYLVRTR